MGQAEFLGHRAGDDHPPGPTGGLGTGSPLAAVENSALNSAVKYKRPKRQYFTVLESEFDR
jgi:hypothetical protein